MASASSRFIPLINRWPRGMRKQFWQGTNGLQAMDIAMDVKNKSFILKEMH